MPDDEGKLTLKELVKKGCKPKHNTHEIKILPVLKITV